MTAEAGPTVLFGDVPFRIEATSTSGLHAVLSALDHVPRTNEPPVGVLRFSDHAPSAPSRTPDYESDGMSFWIEDAELVVRDLLGAGLRATDREVWIGREHARDKAAFHRLLLPGLTHALAYHDRFVLHAAAVVTPSGAGVVIAGESRSGKSTTAFAALRSDWKVLADDAIVIRNGAGGLDMAGIPQVFAVPPEILTAHDHNELTLSQVAEDQRARWSVPGGACSTGWFPVGGLVKTSHGESVEGRLLRLESFAAVQVAMSAFTSVINPMLLRAYMPVVGMLARVGAWELQQSCEDAIRVAATQGWLGRVAEVAETRGTPTRG